MAIGNKNTNNYENKNVYFINVVTKEKGEDGKEKDVKPYFSFRQKTGEVYNEVQKNNAFSGAISKVSTYERDGTAGKTPRVRIIVEDGDDVYFLDFGYTILSRSVFNSLLSLETLEDIAFQIYQTKPNDKGEMFPQISIRQGEGRDNMVRWKFNKDDLPEVKKVRINGKMQSDTEAIDLFFRDKINAKFSNFASSTKPKTSTRPAAAPVTEDSPSDSDVPF